jgi:hypothetical protein
MYQKNYTNYNNQPYNPKKTVKHFTDLEVYQKSLEASVFVSKNLCRNVVETQFIASKANENNAKNQDAITCQDAMNRVSTGNEDIDAETKIYILKNMTALALSIPHQIAEAHSCRFGSSEQCLLILDKAMLGCNKMVVYLEQARDICETGVELAQFEEQTKKYFYIRQKVLNLQRVWRKYIEVAKLEGK